MALRPEPWIAPQVQKAGQMKRHFLEFPVDVHEALVKPGHVADLTQSETMNKQCEFRIQNLLWLRAPSCEKSVQGIDGSPDLTTSSTIAAARWNAQKVLPKLKIAWCRLRLIYILWNCHELSYSAMALLHIMATKCSNMSPIWMLTSLGIKRCHGWFGWLWREFESLWQGRWAAASCGWVCADSRAQLRGHGQAVEDVGPDDLEQESHENSATVRRYWRY